MSFRRRLWPSPASVRGKRLSLLVAVLCASYAAAAEADSLINPPHRLAPDDPAWLDLAGEFARNSATTAEFEEQRFFPFKKEPVLLRGEVRVSAERGLSLHYTAPEERTVILDRAGMIVRDASGQTTPPPDPRASAANAALLHVLRLDFPALAGSFEIYGQREATGWSLALVPRAEAARRTMGNILVDGEGATIRRIELRRSARQRVEILIGSPRTARPFTDDEVKRFFR
jgi:hypothetical protein